MVATIESEATDLVYGSDKMAKTKITEFSVKAQCLHFLPGKSNHKIRRILRSGRGPNYGVEWLSTSRRYIWETVRTQTTNRKS